MKRKRTDVSIEGKFVRQHDILRHKITGELYTVNWQENTKSFVLSGEKCLSRPICFLKNAPQNYEIIGNRIGNSELWYGRKRK